MFRGRTLRCLKYQLAEMFSRFLNSKNCEYKMKNSQLMKKSGFILHVEFLHESFIVEVGV